MYILLGILILVEIITGVEVVRSVNRYCNVNRQSVDEGANDVDSDISVYVPGRDRDRSGNRSDNPQVDEVISVLDTLYVGASSEEKAALDYAKDCIDIAHKLSEYWKG